VSLTIRADDFVRLNPLDPGLRRLGQPDPLPPDALTERWGTLSMAELGLHAPDALVLLRLTGLRHRLRTLPDLSAANLTRLQVRGRA
jgi:hypothetical protein